MVALWGWSFCNILNEKKGGNDMSILIKSGDKFFEIPNDVLEKYKVTKEQFEKGCKEVSADVAGQCEDDVSGQWCLDKPTYGASCGKAPCP